MYSLQLTFCTERVVYELSVCHLHLLVQLLLMIIVQFKRIALVDCPVVVDDVLVADIDRLSS